DSRDFGWSAHLEQAPEEAGGAHPSRQRGDHPAEANPSVISLRMEVAPRVDRLLARAVDEQVSEQRLLREALEEVSARLAHVEETTAALDAKIGPWSDPGAATADLAVRVQKRLGTRLDELEMRLDDMAVTIERRAKDAM